MWIRTQNKQRIINTDQIASIYITSSGKNIRADMVDEGVFELGEYKDRDTCLKVLSEIEDCLRNMWSIYQMPLGGEVK